MGVWRMGTVVERRESNRGVGMSGLSTEEIVRLALEPVGMTELPADSAVYVEGDNLTKVIFGVDVGPAELMLARELGCDGAIAHHPAGGDATLRFAEVLATHIQFMEAHGVPGDVARDAVQEMMTSAVLRAQAANYDRTPAVARLLGLPFLSIHLPLDEAGRRIMYDAIARHVSSVDGEPTIQDAVDAFYTLPEFSEASTKLMVPVGAFDNPLGRFALVHGAGTNGGYSVARAYFEHGIDTVIYIHVAPDQVDRMLGDQRGNLIVTGHIAADLVGINPFVRALEERGVEVVRLGGL
jgi:putative NIF3 family GTP cyclohydrolase 1 type 2